jgi:hypothetical protein
VWTVNIHRPFNHLLDLKFLTIIFANGSRFIINLSTPCSDSFTLLEEFPVKLLPHFSDVTGHTGMRYFVIINEYGPGFSGPDVDTLGPDRASTGGAMEAHKSNFLHPVIYYYEGFLPSGNSFEIINKHKIWQVGGKTLVKIIRFSCTKHRLKKKKKKKTDSEKER